jgi:thiol-disulfide isomerase/thioredoxin
MTFLHSHLPCSVRKSSKGGLVAGLLLITGLMVSAAPKSKPVDLSLKDLNGAKVRLRDQRGKIVVLNFWATWCGPCNAEMPMLVAAEKEYKEKGVVFIGASLDDKKTVDRIPDFLSKYSVSYPVWTGATGDTLYDLRMGEAVPATAFLDQEGAIVARVSGQIREAELRERLDWLLSDRSGPAPKAFVSHVN